MIDEPHKYKVGPLTYEIFQRAGLTNMLDMQRVLDAIEKALAEAGIPLEKVTAE